MQPWLVCQFADWVFPLLVFRFHFSFFWTWERSARMQSFVHKIMATFTNRNCKERGLYTETFIVSIDQLTYQVRNATEIILVWRWGYSVPANESSAPPTKRDVIFPLTFKDLRPSETEFLIHESISEVITTFKCKCHRPQPPCGFPVHLDSTELVEDTPTHNTGKQIDYSDLHVIPMDNDLYKWKYTEINKPTYVYLHLKNYRKMASSFVLHFISPHCFHFPSVRPSPSIIFFHTLRRWIENLAFVYFSAPLIMHCTFKFIIWTTSILLALPDCQTGSSFDLQLFCFKYLWSLDKLSHELHSQQSSSSNIVQFNFSYSEKLPIYTSQSAESTSEIAALAFDWLPFDLHCPSTEQVGWQALH